MKTAAMLAYGLENPKLGNELEEVAKEVELIWSQFNDAFVDSKGFFQLNCHEWWEIIPRYLPFKRCDGVVGRVYERKDDAFGIITTLHSWGTWISDPRVVLDWVPVCSLTGPTFYIQSDIDKPYGILSAIPEEALSTTTRPKVICVDEVFATACEKIRKREKQTESPIATMGAKVLDFDLLIK